MLRLFSIALLLLAGAMSHDAIAADEPPLTIAYSTVGLTRSAKAAPFYLSVNSAGKADLTIDANVLSHTDRVRRQFDVSEEQLAEFRQALDDESFFELEKEYGEIVPDGARTTLTVVRGGRVHTVKIHFLMNWVVANETEKLREPSRALRLLILLRGWFDDPAAADSRPYDERILQVAE